MSVISTATPTWLALRAGADDAARSVELAAAFAALMPPGPVELHDLGAGTGGMTRWLAPRLGGPQSWVLHDGDAIILDQLELRSAVDDAGRPLAVRTVVGHLDALPPEAFRGAAGVTASALLDVVTRDEAARIVAACVHAGAPALFALSVTGEVALDPPDAADGVIARAFNEHQRRDADGRRMLGPDAVAVLTGLFAEAGWHVRREASAWQLAAADAELIEEWLDGWVGAAVAQQPELGVEASGYLDRRRAQLADGTLRVVVHHEDALAWPR
ncbi:SAM-dependent methyltransferase [Microbacterium jejuense]|uniref:SAM-dependent methyltransferase n=1 Tax=Microbacterium jejuense TaxID=1263637 RepID=A0ABS7HIU9_9MICO|nr:SAM-dependent methyltransferase [Microbacterium jejuense]MBW9092355.1 SAM-dependent methyltransferase [Microbacterium jejuense]